MKHMVEHSKNFCQYWKQLSYAQLTNQIIDPLTLDRYLRALAYDLKTLSLNCELVFRHTYSYYLEPLFFLIDSANQFLVQILILLKNVL